MLEMRKNTTSEMSCIQESHQSQHGLKTISKYYWKRHTERYKLVKNVKFYKCDF